MSKELDIRSLSVTAAANLLKVSPKTIREHIARGLPLRKDGRLDMVVYAAWLVGQVASRKTGACQS